MRVAKWGMEVGGGGVCVGGGGREVDGGGGGGGGGSGVGGRREGGNRDPWGPFYTVRSTSTSTTKVKLAWIRSETNVKPR